MCGIAGALLVAGQAALPDPARMITTLRHRGPDGTGFFRSPACALASARLSIIDLETGDQPVANEDESVWTVQNGEIFNFIELRAELQGLGHQFRTRSDTEVIVHAYEEYGDRFVARLSGQFALALWDARRQRLLLARDGVGIRPLFYARIGGRLLFASEVKAILAVAPEAAALDEQGLAQVFTFWGTVGPRTVFKGIRSLPPGHTLVVEKGAERLQRYWDWTFPQNPGRTDLSMDEAAEMLHALLTDVVRQQLRADVPVGAYLSGGLDSSGIAALARESVATLQTFSLTFDDPEFDESSYQSQMAAHLGVRHSSIRCTSLDIGNIFPELIWHTETPVLRTAPAPLMLLARHVHSQGFKVVLTGEGADEVFGGYDLFKEGKIRRFWARQPESAWRPLLLSRLYPYLTRSPVANRHFARLFFGQRLEELGNPFYAHAPRWSTTRGIFRFLSPEMQATLSSAQPEEELREQLPAGFGGWSGLARDQYIEVKTLLEGYLLSSQGDRVSLAHSVEGRVPYLDHRVIEFANALSSRYKLRGLQEKVLLRRSLKGIVPDSILKRAKQPYRAPDSACFFQGERPLPYVQELLSESNLRRTGYFDPEPVSRLLEKCRTGRALGAGDNMAFVAVLSTLLLHEQFFGGRAAQAAPMSA
ncbi:MAG TPA: asparagine synthase (glutamine-hydrolyzing) [Steroidobacteraceae bacterium]|nr:asparagine synthase (glutamine-hydrolyzing) [Steroidobacteraceae bacterium]